MSHDEIIERATKVMHAEVCCPCDPQGCDWTHTREVQYARALADSGLITRPLPTRDQIAMAIFEVLNSPYGSFNVPNDAADAVLALLKEQEAASTPTTAREALDLAWELAHEVKEGQVIPEGARYLEVQGSGLREYTTASDFKIRPGCGPIRTLEPLPEPEPDWLDAHIVLATCRCHEIELWRPRNKKDGTWECTHCGFDCHWSDLRDVTPLYPEGQDA